MIQRIQTVYLALAIVLSVLLVFLRLTLAALVAEVGVYELNSVSILLQKEVGSEAIMSSFPITGAIMLGVFLSVYSIMQYKNRKFQVKLVQAALFVQLIVGALVFFYADKLSAFDVSAQVSYKPVIAILLVNVLLYFLALRGIKSDDALVRSADRLR